MEENHLNLEGDAVPREDDVGDNEPGVRDPEQGLDNHSFPPVFDELRRVFLRNQLGHRLPPPQSEPAGSTSLSFHAGPGPSHIFQRASPASGRHGHDLLLPEEPTGCMSRTRRTILEQADVLNSDPGESIRCLISKLEWLFSGLRGPDHQSG